jgi:hypothetical protein
LSGFAIAHVVGPAFANGVTASRNTFCIGFRRSALGLADRNLKVGIAEGLALGAPDSPEPKPEARRPWWRRLRTG